MRKYHEDIDWVFFQKDVALTPEQVANEVNKLRLLGVRFSDRVPAKNPPLKSPCNF
jgi:hypothetical protein